MRITGGQLRGRVLLSPRGMSIRPTSDRVREAIFNIIGQDLSGRRVLDLFAGTGSMGLETLSRGAACALFIDSSAQSVNLIGKNLALCGHQDSGTILRRDLRKGISKAHPLLKQAYDLAFLDPPYGKSFISFLLENMSTNGILSTRSSVIAESGKTENLPPFSGNFEMVDSRLYGDTRVSLYHYRAEIRNR